MGSSYEAIGPAENIALPPEEKKVENNVEQKAEKVADRKETHSGKCGWSVPAITLMCIFMPLMILSFFAAGAGFGKLWKSD
ncbi:hypothetical protein WUBG_09078 [Wuchereria bancrofti]|uniref:Uncharacterized protein n=1 Tax=Wuchereria bancrofti TaxID=6293 RepID=J9EXW4_WUCBA|nr:hypothetical protein WUBG_09078 [Wuchereria bancrofti]